MKTLEDEIETIRLLTGDLEAVIVIEPEKGHLEKGGLKEDCTGDYAGRWQAECYDDSWVVDKPAVTRPDNAKRESARKELNEIFDTTPFYSAKYAAGKCLSKAENIIEYANRISEQLNANLPNAPKGFAPLREKIKFVDQGKRIISLNDLIHLYRLSGSRFVGDAISEAYDSNICEEVRNIAGEFLGHSSMMVLLHNLFFRDKSYDYALEKGDAL